MQTLIAHKLYQFNDQELQVPHVLLHRLGWVYLHGKLEEINGYDIFSYLIGHEPQKEERGNIVRVHIDECTVIYAHQFVWRSDSLIQRYPDRYKWHGLIVMMGDTEALKDAEKKFDKKSQVL